MVDRNRLLETALQSRGPRGLAQPDAQDEPGQAKGFLGDTYRSLATGVQRLPGIAAGVADIGAGLAGGAVRGAATALGANEGTVSAIERFYDRPFDRATDWVGEQTGFQPGEWAEKGAERYSPQMQAAQQATQQVTQEYITDRWEAGDKWGAVRGLGPTTLEYLKNPRSIQALVGESLPMTVAGGVAGAGVRAGMGTRMVMDKTAQTQLAALGPVNQTAVRSAHRMSAPVAAGIGEGAVIAGHVMDEIDPEVDAFRAALASLGAGVFGGAVGAGGAALAGRMGFVDIDAAIAGRSLGANLAGGTTTRSWPARIAGGALFEGLQEIPQESMEEIMENWAEGKPLFDGVLEVVAPAFLAGAAMGGGVNILRPGSRDEFDPDDQRLFGADLQKRTPGEPAPTSGQEMLKGRTTEQLEATYQRVMGLVQNAPTDDEVAQQAFTMLGDIRTELQSRGVTNEMLDLEAAQARYAQLQMQIPATLERYQQALKEGDVEKAQKIHGNIQKLRGEFAEIHNKWGKQAESQTAVILRWARANLGDTATDKIKKMVTAKGQLNTTAHLQIENAKKLSDAELAWQAENAKGDTVKDIATAWVADVRFNERTAEERADLAASFEAQRTAGRTRKGKAAPVSEESANRTYIKQVEDRAKRAVDEGRVAPEVAQAAVDKERTRLGMEPSKPIIKQDTPTDLTSFVTQDTAVDAQQAALPVTDEQQADTEQTPSEREVNAVVAQFRQLAGSEAMQSLPPVQSQDMRTFLEVLEDMDASATVDDVVKTVAQRTRKEGAKARAPKTVRENIKMAMRKLRIAAGLDPNQTPAVSDVVGMYLTQADTDTAIFDENAPQRDVTQMAEEAGEQALDTRDIPDGFQVGTPGQAGVGTSVNSEQLTEARNRVVALQNNLTELRARLEKEPAKAEQIAARMVSTNEKLQEQQKKLVELEKVVADEKAVEKIDNELRAQEFEQEVRLKAERALREVTEAILAELDGPRGQQAGRVWDQSVQPELNNGPMWADLVATDIQAARMWLEFYALATENQLPSGMTLQGTVRNVMKAYSQPDNNITLQQARDIAARPPMEPEVLSGPVNQLQRPVQRPASRGATVRPRAAEQTGPVDGTEQAAQNQAAQEEVTDNAAPIRENQGRPAQPRGATQEGQADRRRDVQQNAQAQREASAPQVGDLLGKADGAPYGTERSAKAAQTSKRKADIETNIEQMPEGFWLRVVAAPTEADLSDRIDQVRELAGQLNQQTRKRYDNMAVKIASDKKLGLREKIAAYDDIIERLTNAVRGQEANRAGAEAFAAQQAEAQETTPGVTPETNAQLDNQKLALDLSARQQMLENAADEHLDDANVQITMAEAQALFNADDFLDNLPAISAALDALDAAIVAAQSGEQGGPQTSVGAEPGQGMTVEQVFQLIEQDFRDAPGIRYIVHPYVDESTLPAAVRRTINKQRAEGNEARGVFDQNTGLVYIAARRMTSQTSVREIIMHELGVHLAVTGRSPVRSQRLAEKIVAWYQDTLRKDEAQWSTEERLSVYAVGRVNTAAKAGPQPQDELLAYFVEGAIKIGIDPTQLSTIKEGPLRTWFREFKEMVKELMQRVDAALRGDVGFTLTAQDIVDLTYGMAQLEISDTARTLQPRARPDVQADPQTSVDALVTRMPKSTQWWWRDLQGKLLKAAGITSFSREIVDWSGRLGLTAAKEYFNSLTGKIAIRSEYLAKIQHIVAPTKKWDRKHRKAFNDFLYFSAYREEWGFEPTWLENHNYDPNSDVAKAFEEMLAKFPENQRETARRTAIAMFQHAHVMHSNLQKHMRSEIETSYTRLIAAAKNPNQRKVQEAERDAALRDFDLKQQGFRNAYLPLRRWGEWAVVYKSPQLREAEAAKDRTRIRQLKGDFKHYVVLFEENERTALATREKFQALLRRETGDQTIEFPEPFPRERQREMLNEEIPFDMINKLKQQVDLGPDVSQSVKSSIMNALDRMYITALSEASSRKSELERMSVRGANDDMIRAFIEQGTGVAALAAALDTNAGTRELIQEMKDQAHDSSKPHRRERMGALNELLARHAQALEYTDHPVISQVMGTTSVWMLMSNPAYYIQNSTQPFMLTFPWLAGQFGAAKTMARMTQAYPRILKLYRATKDGSLLDPKLLDSIENDPSLKQLFEDLQMRGLLDVGIAMELGSFKDAKTKAGRAANFVHTKMVGAVRTVEVFNRGVTAMVAYEMKLAQLRKANPQVTLEKHQADAREFAMDAVAQTQGDYSGVNAPRLISMIPAGKLVTQFRKFQLIQIGLLTRVLYQSFKGATKAERLLARRQFGYLMMMHGTVGGMLGLPIPMVMWWAVAHAFGDEDEPADIELLLRREIGNKEVADLLLRGLPAYMGVNTSERLGMGMTFSLLPFVDLKPTRDGALVVMASALGPWTTPLARGIDGVGQIQNGNVLAGIAQMQPALTMNLIRAYEQHTVGVRSRQGVTLLEPEELGYLELVTQGLGWPSKTLTDRHLVAGMKWKATEHFKGRASRIRKVYADAYRDGDARTMDRAIEEWVRLQEMKVRYGLGNYLPLKDLTKAPLERMKKEQRVIGGVQFESTERGFVEDMFM